MFRNYLNLREILSQSYLNKYSILLLLILIKLIALKNSLLKNLSLELLDKSVCDNDEVQPVLNTVHKMIVDKLQTLEVSGLVSIILLLRAIKNMVLFVIELFLGTYICILNAALKGTTEFAFDASEGVIQAVNATVVSATNDIESALQGLSQFINDLVKGFNAISNFLTGNKLTQQASEYQNQINISLGELKDKIMIPGDVLDKIDKARNVSFDGLSKLDNGTQTLVATPFDKVVQKLNVMKDNYNFRNSTPSPLNYKQECLKDMNKLQQVQSDLVEVVENVSKIIFIGLIIAMALSIIYVAFIQWREWKRMDQFIYEEQISTDIEFRNRFNVYNNDVLYIIEKRMGYYMNEKMIWMFSYLFSKAARIVFFFGLMGIISVALQFALVNHVQSHLNNHMESFIGNSSDSSNSVTNYVRSMNDYINDTQTDMNNELFGNIKETSLSINSTIVNFMDDLNDTLTSIFGKTPLSGAVDTIVYCTIGRKLEKVESGLTWMNRNLNIDLPLLGDDLLDDLQEIKFLQPQSVLNKINKLIEVYKQSIWLEFYISLGMFVLWLFQVIVGIIIIGLRIWKYDQEEDIDIKDDSSSVTFAIRNLAISHPHELSEEQKQEYGYPLSNPYVNRKDINSSSSYYPSTIDMSKYE